MSRLSDGFYSESVNVASVCHDPSLKPQRFILVAHMKLSAVIDGVFEGIFRNSKVCA